MSRALARWCAAGSRWALGRAAANTECACSNTGLKFVGTQLECWSQRWPLAGAEARQVWAKIRSGNVTMGEIGNGFVYGFGPIGFWTLIGFWLGIGEILTAPIVGPSWIRPIEED
jgi:hypothetical protein